MTLDAGKSLRSVITEKEQRRKLVFVQDYEYPHICRLLHVTSESPRGQLFLLPLFNEITEKQMGCN